MFKPLVVLALGVAISACATRPSAQSAESAEAAQPAQAQSRRVCEVIEDDATGTKIARRQECRNVAVDKHKQPKAN